jgi:hypothetical protein
MRPLALLLLAFAFPLHATLSSSAITGRVLAGEASGPGVKVTAASVALQQPRSTTTGTKGTYWLGALPPGEYDVTFSKAGHSSLTRRVIVELGRVARADARIEVSADEESVTSTATQLGVTDTTTITSHFDDETLDRLPGRDYAAAIAPDPYAPSASDIDGTPTVLVGVPLPEDTIEQITIVRAAAPVEHDAYGGRLYALRTRSGREDFFFSVRDTLSSWDWNDGGPFAPRGSGLEHSLQANGGGRIVSQRLWFFGALWNGGDATRYTSDSRGVLVKLDAQLNAANHIGASYAYGATDWYTTSTTSAASLRHTGVYGPRLITESIVSRASAQVDFPPAPGIPGRPSNDVDYLAARASFVLPGDHVLTAGGSTVDTGHFDSHALFLGDRWSRSRFIVNAGLRYQDAPFGDASVLPRVAATYDLRGDGRHAIAASFGDYEKGVVSSDPQRVAALGYVMAIGTTGAARIDVLRRDLSYGQTTNSLQLEARYRLFDRFEAGGTYTYTRADDEPLYPVAAHHDANAWAGLQLPVGAHEFGVTLLQHYTRLAGYNPGTGFEADTFLGTDMALRYAVPLSRVALTFAADVANVFGIDPQLSPRTARVWTRVSLR